MDAAAEKRADGEHDRARTEFDSRDGDDAAYRFVFDDEVAALLLEQGEVRLILERAADERLVELAVGLHARRAHRGTLARIESARLDRRRVGRTRHHPAQRVDLLHEMTLADPADGGIAAHLSQRLDRLREQHRSRAHAGGRERRFGAGMSATDDDYVKCCRLSQRSSTGSKG